LQSHILQPREFFLPHGCCRRERRSFGTLFYRSINSIQFCMR
ncbi:unnamed protein product, partial [Ascophyllum nodosum]